MIVPDSVRLLLHDYMVPAVLDGAVWDRAIMERVMERGGWDDIRWLMAEFGPARVADYLRARGHRVLAPQELRFWAWFGGIPAPLADTWVQAARERVRAWQG